MTFAPNLDGVGDPYRALQPYFDTDFTDASAIGNGRINFDFLNTVPGTHFGYNGYTPLVEFQVLLNPSSPSGADLTVTLGALGIPPNGTAVQDESANNILLPSDPLNPGGNVSTAHILVGRRRCRTSAVLADYGRLRAGTLRLAADGRRRDGQRFAAAPPPRRLT